MGSRYENDVLFEEQGTPPERPRYSVGGVLVGGLVAVAVVVGLIGFGRVAADRLAGFTLGDDDSTAADVEPGLARAIEVPSGSSARDIGTLLVDAGVVGSTADFEDAVNARQAASGLIAGQYELMTGMTVNAAIDLLLEGPFAETFRLTVREGLRIDEVLAEIARQTEFEEEGLRLALESSEVTSRYLPDTVEGVIAWEGLLFPDTYEFFVDVTEAEILQRLSDQFGRNMNGLNFEAAAEDGFTPYDIVIVASMIEAEAQLDGERPLVSSVIYNRIDQGIALQIDATVLYALGERRTGLTLDDLEVDSPYNTYLVPGLPPTPIGTPGLASLVAATKPQASEYLYYVLTASDGTHSFTASYDEFLAFKAQAKADGILP